MNGDVGILCRICHRKKSGLMYCCGVSCGYCIHAICAKEMINGLYENGIKPPEKSKMMGTSTLKLASHVIFGIIGDLFEGIGEGIGEALVDSIARGRCAKNHFKKDGNSVMECELQCTDKQKKDAFFPLTQLFDVKDNMTRNY
ncbi:hypothetical protein M5K25_011484 [Dendrobium thyrsiflorum]|uniref:DC1 domain-containing protein n=1 Tax=Dendrobium thyrsiflorum TaxID=117978 RepID=A0ABD0V9U1_DENTH